MKKSILFIALATVLSAPAVSIAAPTVYGNIHISLNQAGNDIAGAENNLTLSSNTSAIGVKGSEDIGDGVKAIYKVEFQVNLLEPATTLPSNDPTDFAPREGQGDIEGRDQFAGIKFGIGVFKAGTMSTNYKQTGAKVDPLYRTPLEARGFLKMQSAVLHDTRRGINRGRQTNTLQYVSPNMAGVKIVANTTFSGSNDETIGIGVRWQNKTWLVYADWIDSQTGDLNDTTDPGKSVAKCDTTTNCSVESAYKVGGSYGTKEFFVSLQYEAAENRTGGNYTFGSAYYNFNKNNQIIFTAGQYSAKDSATDSDSKGYALAYNHKMSRLANLYVGYGKKLSSDDLSSGLANAGDESMLTMGVRKRF